jgi:hypothetical protein
MAVKFIFNPSAYIFKFATPNLPCDIDYIEISRNSALNKYKNEMQHLVIIKRCRSQENISMNHNDIIKLLAQYELSNYNKEIQDHCCN